MTTPRILPKKTDRNGYTTVNWKMVRETQAAEEARKTANGTRVEDIGFGWTDGGR